MEGPDKTCAKLVYQPDVLGLLPTKPNAASCVFGICELPKTRTRIVVTPRNSLGVCGQPLTQDVCAK